MRCWGFHKWDKWIEGPAIIRNSWTNITAKVIVQKRSCKRCGLTKVRMI